jgi:site-specific recombinase XerD
MRGLAANTLDAYGRDLDSYLKFLESAGVELESVVRSTIGAYIQDIAQHSASRSLNVKPKVRTTLSNATLQQHLTVIRLFYDYLVEEKVCARHPLRPLIAGRSLVQRHHRLPWIPTDEQWQSILQSCKKEPVRNRLMLAMSMTRRFAARKSVPWKRRTSILHIGSYVFARKRRKVGVSASFHIQRPQARFSASICAFVAS